MSIDPTPSFVRSALSLALRTLHITLPAAILAPLALASAADMLDSPAPPGDEQLMAWLTGGALALAVAALSGGVIGAVCWHAVQYTMMRPPAAHGWRRAALLGVIFGIASLLVIPIPFILGSLWLAIPLAMIEGLAVPAALAEARRRAASVSLMDQRAAALVGACVPFALAGLATFAISFTLRGDWRELALVGFGIMAASVALVPAIVWLLACCGATYADLAQQPPDAEHLADLFT